MQGTQNNGSSGGSKPTLSWSQPASQQNGAQKPLMPQATVAKAQNKKESDTEKKSSVTMFATLFIGGLIVGAILGWAMHGSSGSSVATTATTANDNVSTNASAKTSTQTPSSDTSPSTGSEMSSASLALTIPSPQASGLYVIVSQVAVTRPTWVVVYEDHAGVPGNALGAGLFFPTSMGGENSGTVELLRGTLPGHSYLVGESLDDGDKMFSMDTDKPVRDSSGNPLFVELTTN